MQPQEQQKSSPGLDRFIGHPESAIGHSQGLEWIEQYYSDVGSIEPAHGHEAQDMNPQTDYRSKTPTPVLPDATTDAERTRQNLNGDPHRVHNVHRAIQTLLSRADEHLSAVNTTEVALRRVIGDSTNVTGHPGLLEDTVAIETIVAPLRNLPTPLPHDAEARVILAVGELEPLYVKLNENATDRVHCAFKRLGQVKDIDLYRHIQLPTDTRADLVIVVLAKHSYLEGIRTKLRDSIENTGSSHISSAFARLLIDLRSQWRQCQLLISQIDIGNLAATDTGAADKDVVLAQSELQHFDKLLSEHEQAVEHAQLIHHKLYKLQSTLADHEPTPYPAKIAGGQVVDFESALALCEVSQQFRQSMSAVLDDMLAQLGKIDEALQSASKLKSTPSISADTIMEPDADQTVPADSSQLPIADSGVQLLTLGSAVVQSRPKRKASAHSEPVASSMKRTSIGKRELGNLAVEDPALFEVVEDLRGGSRSSRKTRSQKKEIELARKKTTQSCRKSN